MDLRQLSYAVAVVDHGGFTRAAVALHVAQPSLSQSVRRLENELGAPLFLRVGRAVQLSDAGEAFLGPARRLLRDAEGLRALLGDRAALLAGTLDLVALPTAAVDPLAEMIGGFRRAYPNVLVRVAEPTGVEDLERMLLDGRCEVGLGEADRPTRDGLVVRPVVRQDLYAVFAHGSPTPPHGRITLRALAGHPLVLGRPGTSVRDLLDRAFAGVGRNAQVAVETGQRDAIAPLALAGAGVGVVPEPIARAASERGGVIALITPRLRRSLGLIHRGTDLSPAARAFLRLAVERT
jgi:LysR family transcriptional regulator, carnitine catabolism transcriptional activator